MTLFLEGQFQIMVKTSGKVQLKQQQQKIPQNTGDFDIFCKVMQ